MEILYVGGLTATVYIMYVAGRLSLGSYCIIVHKYYTLYLKKRNTVSYKMYVFIHLELVSEGSELNFNFKPYYMHQ